MAKTVTKKISRNTDKKTIFIELIAVLIAIASFLLQIYPPLTAKQKSISLILFVAIVGYTFILYFIDYFVELVRDKILFYKTQIENNTEQLNEIKKIIDTEKRFYDLDKRLSLLESLKNVEKIKRGR